MLGGVHGKNEAKVFTELSQAVEDAISLMKSENMHLPSATSNKRYSGKIALRIPQELHKSLTIRATQTGESLNKFIQHRLESVV